MNSRANSTAKTRNSGVAITGRCIAIVLLALSVWPYQAQAVDEAVIAAQNRRIRVIKSVAPGVVAIFARGGAGGGSGVLISPDGFALTNFHVVSSAGSFMKCGLNDGVLYDAVIVGIDPTGDVALIKLLGRDKFPFVKMGDSDKLRVGDWAYAMGNPFLLATDFQPTVTYGIVSGVHRYQYGSGTFLEYTDCIQVVSSINPGNSGGPLFNDDGELVGINGRGSFEKRGRVNSGAGYAISINQIKHFMDHLRSGRIVDHATLGATVATSADGSVIVNSILETSAAYRRGLRIDDELVSFAGRSIRSVNQLKNIVGIYPKGWKLPLVFRREGEKKEIFVRLRGLHRQSELTPRPRRSPRPKPSDKRKPDGKKPGDKQPKPKSPHSPNAPPKTYKHLYVKKQGFANYYFNQEAQKRFLSGIAAWGDFTKSAGTWKLSGKTDKNKAFEFTLADRGLGLEIGQDAYFQPLDNTNFVDEPKGTGGLLVAMHHLRTMLTRGTDGFTEMYYLGSEPLDGIGEKADVLVTTLTGVETRWYLDRNKNRLVGFDTRLTPEDEACEIRFERQKEFAGHTLPSRFSVVSGENTFATFEVSRVQLGKKDSRPPSRKKKVSE